MRQLECCPTRAEEEEGAHKGGNDGAQTEAASHDQEGVAGAGRSVLWRDELAEDVGLEGEEGRGVEGVLARVDGLELALGRVLRLALALVGLCRLGRHGGRRSRRKARTTS